MEKRICNVIDYLEASVEKVPDKPAFVGEHTFLSFIKLQERVDSIATFLIEKEVHGEAIFVFMEKSPEEVACFLGIIEAGNYHVALDMEMADSRLNHILEIVSAPILICDRLTEQKARSLGFSGEIYIYDEINSLPNKEKILEIRRGAIDTDPIYVVFTSGSTGVPKGVIANHRSVIDYIEELGQVLDCSEKTIFGNQAPLYLDACLKDFYTTLKYGATTYFIPKKLFTGPVKLIEYLNENKINTICFVVSALTIFTKLGAFEFEKPKFLEVIAFGGEVFPLSHLKEWRETCPDARFINLYGPTECTGMSSFYLLEKEKEPEEPLPIGKPFPNTDIFLLDEEDKSVLRGEKGEICIRGTSLTLGYYNDFARTRESFVQNPLNTKYLEMIYRTGDIGYFNEQNDLVFVGRKDNQIKYRGYRIELEEIEALGNSLPKVARGVCLYQREKEKLFFAYQGKAEIEEIKKFFRKNLPPYLNSIKVVRLEKLPLMMGGKIDRQRILKSLGE